MLWFAYAGCRRYSASRLFNSPLAARSYAAPHVIYMAGVTLWWPAWLRWLPLRSGPARRDSALRRSTFAGFRFPLAICHYWASGLLRSAACRRFRPGPAFRLPGRTPALTAVRRRAADQAALNTARIHLFRQRSDPGQLPGAGPGRAGFIASLQFIFGVPGHRHRHRPLPVPLSPGCPAAAFTPHAVRFITRLIRGLPSRRVVSRRSAAAGPGRTGSLPGTGRGSAGIAASGIAWRIATAPGRSTGPPFASRHGFGAIRSVHNILHNIPPGTNGRPPQYARQRNRYIARLYR